MSDRDTLDPPEKSLFFLYGVHIYLPTYLPTYLSQQSLFREYRERCDGILEEKRFKDILPQGQRWTEELTRFLASLVSTRDGMRKGMRLDSLVTKVGWVNVMIRFRAPMFLYLMTSLNYRSMFSFFFIIFYYRFGLDIQRGKQRVPVAPYRESGASYDTLVSCAELVCSSVVTK